MSDLIERQAAIELIHGLYPSAPILRRNRERWEERYKPYIEAEKALEQLPSAEPEIVRCGQCKYAEVADAQDNQDGYTCQFHRGSIWFSGSYCSWGERRTDGVDS